MLGGRKLGRVQSKKDVAWMRRDSENGGDDDDDGQFMSSSAASELHYRHHSAAMMIRALDAKCECSEGGRKSDKIV